MWCLTPVLFSYSGDLSTVKNTVIFGYNEAFSSIEPVTEKPMVNVTTAPPEGSDTCIGLAPSFLNVISFVIIRAVRGLGTSHSVDLSSFSQ